MKDNYKAQNLKFYAKDEEKARRFQRRAFELGYKWAAGDRTVRNIAFHLFYLDKDGNLFVTYSEKAFIENYSKQITLEEFLAPQRGEVVQVRNDDGDVWIDAEFIYDLCDETDYPYIVKCPKDDLVQFWKQMRPIRKPTFKDLQATIDLLEQAIDGLKKLKP